MRARWVVNARFNNEFLIKFVTIKFISLRRVRWVNTMEISVFCYLRELCICVCQIVHFLCSDLVHYYSAEYL